MNKLRNTEINRSLAKTISNQRLGKYLAEKNDDLDAALGLYERNTKLAECLYTPLQSLEICLRNTLNTEMVRVYGDEWMDQPTTPLNQHAIDKIAEAKAEKPGGTPDDYVAELKFSFWVGLLSATYDSTLWRRALYRGFLASPGRRRVQVHGRLNAIRRFRNRVAHHEPIYGKALQMHDEIIEAIGWMCKDTKAWTEHHSRFLTAYHET